MMKKEHIIITGMVVLQTLLLMRYVGINLTNEVIIAITGIAVIGSVIPDIDALSSHVKKSSINVIKLMVKYFIYIPLAWAFSFIFNKDLLRHRGFAHTILFSAVVSGLLFLIIKNVFVSAGLFVGCLMHIIEDGMTKSGVKPFEPLSNASLHGRYITGSLSIPAFVSAAYLILLAIEFTHGIDILSSGLITYGLFIIMAIVAWI